MSDHWAAAASRLQSRMIVALIIVRLAIKTILVFKLSVRETSLPYLLEIVGLFTQGSRPGRTFGESVGGNIKMDSSDWSNGSRYHVFDT